MNWHDEVHGIWAPAEFDKDRATRIFNEQVLPSLGFTPDEPVSDLTNPVFAVVGGQPGSGKSTTIRRMKDDFGRPTMVIVGDDFFTFHPGMNDARLRGKVGWGEADTYSRFFRKAAQAFALERNMNIIVESCYDPAPLFQNINRHQKYRTEFTLVATDRLTSFGAIWLRAAQGYENRSMANCAVLDKKTYRRYYAQWPSIILREDNAPSSDSLRIVDRDGNIHYENERILFDGGCKWKNKPNGLETLTRLRSGPYSLEKSNSIRRDWENILDSDWLYKHPEAKEFRLHEEFTRVEAIVDCVSDGLDSFASTRFQYENELAEHFSVDRSETFLSALKAQLEKISEESPMALDVKLSVDGSIGRKGASRPKSPERTRNDREQGYML